MNAKEALREYFLKLDSASRERYDEAQAGYPTKPNLLDPEARTVVRSGDEFAFLPNAPSAVRDEYNNLKAAADAEAEATSA